MDMHACVCVCLSLERGLAGYYLCSLGRVELESGIHIFFFCISVFLNFPQ